MARERKKKDLKGAVLSFFDFLTLWFAKENTSKILNPSITSYMIKCVRHLHTKLGVDSTDNAQLIFCETR